MIGKLVGITAERVRELRDQGLEYAQVAEALHTNRHTLWAWRKEQGYDDGYTKRELSMRRTAHRLGMNPDTFIDELEEGRLHCEAAKEAGVTECTWWQWRKERAA